MSVEAHRASGAPATIQARRAASRILVALPSGGGAFSVPVASASLAL